MKTVVDKVMLYLSCGEIVVYEDKDAQKVTDMLNADGTFKHKTISSSNSSHGHTENLVFTDHVAFIKVSYKEEK